MATRLMFALAAGALLGAVELTPEAAWAGESAARAKLSLDGVWSFATDPDSRGETDKWFLPDAKLPAMPLPGYAPTADGTIRVPGIWDNQGYGTETDKVRHHFVGKGWYKRPVQVPKDWKGKRIFLAVTGVCRYSKIWLGDAFLGEHVGFLSEQVYDVTKLVGPGQTAALTIQVDSKQRWEVDALYGACMLADYMDVAWGGIWGHVYLEARADAWLDDLYVQTDIDAKTCTVSASLNGQAEAADGLTLDVYDKKGKRVATRAQSLQPQKAEQPLRATVAIPDAQLWTPDTPVLYTARLSLTKGANPIDAVESRFGLRRIAIDGYRILLNGQRIMLCGYGDDHIYPEQMAMPSDKALYLERLRLIRSYGFNHVRHHSTIMPPEYYEACDEVGILSTAEFPIVYEPYIPGSGDTWKAHVPAGTDPKPAFDTYHREWAAAIRRNRNHPSILCWVMGNELYPDFPIRYTFRDIAQKLDPDRLYLDSDGVDAGLLGDPKRDRPTVAIYDIQFSEWSDPVVNREKFATPKPVKPVLSHEAGNFITFSRPDVVDLFQHNIKPFWMDKSKAKLEKLGLLQEAFQWADKSERLYAYLHKYNVEWLRKNPYLSGYHWWLFQDYWTSANGLVDFYFRPKSITPEEVRAFNNEVVLLQDGLDQTYRGNGRLDVKLLTSNFSPAPLKGDLKWEVKLGDTVVAKQRVSDLSAAQGDVSEAARISLALPDPAAPSGLTLSAEFTAGGQRYANRWTTRLYPSAIRPAAAGAPVFSSASRLKTLSAWGFQPPPQGPLDAHAVYITDDCFDSRVMDALERGASVVCLDSGESFLDAYAVTFRTTWWKAGDSADKNHTGTFVYDHPVTRQMAPDGWCDGGWFYLLEGAKKFVVEKAPARPDVIVRGLTSMAMVEDDALLFSVGVGKGCLIVSGLNHVGAEGRPENEWLLAKLLDYAATFPHPKANWPVTLFKPVFGAPDGCQPGFRRVVENAANAPAPEKAAWYSHKADSATVYVCRQDRAGNAVTWETAPYAPDAQPADRVTFAFAGAFGYSSEPKTDGFVLEVNGKEALRFDMPAAERWTSDDKRVELRFETKRTVSVDTFGLFYVTVSRELLTPDQPCRLCVRALGSGSRRWFGLYPYTDLR